jgi:hypothetical protein
VIVKNAVQFEDKNDKKHGIQNVEQQQPWSLK